MVAHPALIYKQIRLRSRAELRAAVCRDGSADALMILRDIIIYRRSYAAAYTSAAPF